MTGKIMCKACMTENKPGAILCENCGDPLEIPVGTAGPSAVVLPTPAVNHAGIAGTACRLVDAGKVTDREFELPADDFEFTMGRPDLGEGIIPDVDLTKFVEKVQVGQETGYTVSRKQAVISRRMGRLYLKATGNAKTMVRPTNEDWGELPKDQEVELQPGYRFRFGGSTGYVIFELV